MDKKLIEIENKLYAALTHLYYADQNDAEDLILEVYNTLKKLR